MTRITRLASILLIAAILVPVPAVVANDSPATPAATPADFGPPTATVHPGGSIQEAVDAADPGDVIAIEPGTYREAVLVRTAELTLVGLGTPDDPVVIENPGEKTNGVEVLAGADGFVLANVTVRRFDKTGVYLTEIDGFLLQNVTAEDNGEYGYFPVLTANGVIEDCVASGHTDAGIYIGQSEQIDIRGNTSFGNVSGILVENVRSVRVVGNESYDNRAGIWAVLLPGLEWTTSFDIVFEGNRVHDNNHAPFPTAEDAAAALPAGIGILVLGPDRVTIRGNEITGNDFLGIGVGSVRIAALIGVVESSALAGIEPDADDVRVEGNTLTDNGTKSSVPLFPAADLIWDGSGTGTCWADNRFATSSPAELPPCPDAATAARQR